MKSRVCHPGTRIRSRPAAMTARIRSCECWIQCERISSPKESCISHRKHFQHSPDAGSGASGLWKSGRDARRDRCIDTVGRRYTGFFTNGPSPIDEQCQSHFATNDSVAMKMVRPVASLTFDTKARTIVLGEDLAGDIGQDRYRLGPRLLVVRQLDAFVILKPVLAVIDVEEKARHDNDLCWTPAFRARKHRPSDKPDGGRRGKKSVPATARHTPPRKGLTRSQDPGRPKRGCGCTVMGRRDPLASASSGRRTNIISNMTDVDADAVSRPHASTIRRLSRANRPIDQRRRRVRGNSPLEPVGRRPPWRVSDARARLGRMHPQPPIT